MTWFPPSYPVSAALLWHVNCHTNVTTTRTSKGIPDQDFGTNTMGGFRHWKHITRTHWVIQTVAIFGRWLLVKLDPVAFPVCECSPAGCFPCMTGHGKPTSMAPFLGAKGLPPQHDRTREHGNTMNHQPLLAIRSIIDHCPHLSSMLFTLWLTATRLHQLLIVIDCY